MIGLPIAKATLREVGGGGVAGAAAALASAVGVGGAVGNELKFKFNPEKLIRTKSAKWRGVPGKSSSDEVPGQANLQYTGIGEDSLTADLLFDDTTGFGLDSLAGALGGKKTVEDYADQLFKWLTIEGETQKEKKQPATLEFTWGTGLTFKGVLMSVRVTYLVFNSEGKPTRALASITMYAKPEPTKGTNPTSGGEAGRTSTQVHEGDTLASISYQQYGDPNLWRAIAAGNDIEDPARVPVGTRLLVPSRRDALALSARERPDG
jgi:hypothetical protein